MNTAPADINVEFTDAVRFIRPRIADEALKVGDDDAFATALLDYLRKRQSPKLLFDLDPAKLREIASLARTHDPKEHAWEKRIADEACQGRLNSASNPYCDRFDPVDRETFDFTTHECSDPQSIYGLCRMRWIASLARTYWNECDEEYFEGMLREWDFFARVTPIIDDAVIARVGILGELGTERFNPPFWCLDSYIRLTNWWWGFWLSLPAPHMTPRRAMVLLARCLRLFDLVAAHGIGLQEHNFTAMQMEAIYLWSQSLPELIGMNVWKQAARNHLHFSHERAVFADGVHWEKSISYHEGCIRWYGTSALLARRNGEPFQEPYEQRLRNMGRFADALVMPDGNSVLLSDSDRVAAWKPTHSLLYCFDPTLRFAHPTAPTYFSLWASNGQTWDRDEMAGELEPTAVFPNGGVGVASRSDGALILDNGPTHAGHSHQDNLTVHFEAMGQPVLVDPGRWLYARDLDRNWVLHPVSHNTIYIEDEPYETDQRIGQGPFDLMSPDDQRVGPMVSQQTDGIAMLRSSFRGHHIDRAAATTRTAWFALEGDPWLVICDDIDSTTKHTWSNSWLLPAEVKTKSCGEGAWSATLSSGINLTFAVASNGPLRQREQAQFWCPNYGEKSPAQWLRFTGDATQSRRVFVFQPGDAVPPSVSLDGDAIIVHVAGRERRLKADT